MDSEKAIRYNQIIDLVEAEIEKEKTQFYKIIGGIRESFWLFYIAQADEACLSFIKMEELQRLYGELLSEQSGEVFVRRISSYRHCLCCKELELDSLNPMETRAYLMRLKAYQYMLGYCQQLMRTYLDLEQDK